MLDHIRRYARWLHLQWPAGTVETLPEVGDDGATNVRGLFVCGDLTGIPLLKFSLDSGTRAARAAADGISPGQGGDRHDLVIVGAGVSGVAAAAEASRLGLDVVILESAEPFFTIVNFPKGKPIYTYPREMEPEGPLRVTAEVKESLVDELEEQRRAHGIEPREGRAVRVAGRDGDFTVELAEGEPLRARRVIVAIGRSGDFRRLNVPGEDLPKVYNRLHDPQDFCGQRALVVGGGDSALETAIALGRCGAEVTLSYRKDEFSRPKPENVENLHKLTDDGHGGEARVEHPSSERISTAVDDYIDPGEAPGSVTLEMGSEVKEIREDEVVLETKEGERTLPNAVVFAMIGREAPLEFFRRSGVHVAGDWRGPAIAGLVAFLAFAVWLYHWKAPYAIPFGWQLPGWLVWEPAGTLDAIAGLWEPVRRWFDTPGSLGHTLKISMSSRSFYYTFLYAAVVLVFGIRRIRYRKTPYITLQTTVLTAIQVLPLFLLPEIILPWLGHNGAWEGGAGRWFADTFFPEANYGHGREYWRAYGFVLAWPLMAWNWFTDQPLWGWLILGSIQTFALIPLMIYYWGKGAYCGWICSCGALAETLGDRHRHKMPHGPLWNRVNFVGQAFLLFAVVLMLLRIVGWMPWGGWARDLYDAGAKNLPFLSYRWMVDLLWAGILGVGLYFHFSGRVWCRFACPLAALMHVYTRFSRFRILSEKKKCISCNVCTSVCHQGIDVMNFANKGLPMTDPECVRCSACVQSCPTGVLYFGQVDDEGNEIARDRLAASPVRMREGE